jgi:lipopolysaccharide transport system permease protein
MPTAIKNALPHVAPRAIPGITPAKPTVVIDPSTRHLYSDLKEIWEYRELLLLLVWRDLKVRYTQTAIGGAWAILQPLVNMLIFTVIFGTFAKIPSDGLPYPIFAYTALLPWTYFASSLNRCVVSVVGDAHLISKVYFPRLILPLCGVVSGLVDFALAFIVLLGMMVWFGIFPTWGVLALPLFLVLALATALGVGLWLSALNVKYRDVSHVIPFLIQIWMYASPVVYPLSLVPEGLRLLYSLNPMVGVIESFRSALLGTQSPALLVTGISAVLIVATLGGGIAYFKAMERTFADVV